MSVGANNPNQLSIMKSSENALPCSNSQQCFDKSDFANGAAIPARGQILCTSHIDEGCRTMPVKLYTAAVDSMLMISNNFSDTPGPWALSMGRKTVHPIPFKACEIAAK
mmetsp:Transcript_39225/g.62766  ORF Transcript_39225/g.62766 Transcript_39225/m.62766 type:complete len:109 (-) Transcript_39225:952-1278(-)